MNNLAKIIGLGGRRLNKALAMHYLFSDKGIPKGYIPLEYLKSTGTQYIDLGITPSDDMEFEIEYQSLASRATKLFGCENTSKSLFDAYNVGRGGATIRVFAHGGTHGGSPTDITTIAGQKNILKLVIKNGTYSVYVNGEIVATSPAVGVVPNLNIFLFASNRNGSPDGYGPQIVYGCRVKKSGEFVGDFRPFLNDNGEAGLYNTVDRKFYPNIGTGEFEYEYSVESYVKDSLIMQLDGIKNTRDGHNAEATVWEDLVGDVNFTKTANFSFGDNYIATTGKITSNNAIVVPSEYTLEIIYQYDGTNYHAIGFSGGSPMFKGRRVGLLPRWVDENNWTAGLEYTYALDINGTHSVAVSQNAKGRKCYHNGIFNNGDSVVSTYTSVQNLVNYSASEVLTGKIFAIRLYNRSLTDEELARNYEIDRQRFGLTETASVMMLGMPAETITDELGVTEDGQNDEKELGE